MRKLYRMIALVAVVIALSGCAGGPDYIIERGCHSSGAHFVPHFGDRAIGAEVIFDESCKYSFPSGEWKDWNKLFGLSYGIHQAWSIRIGWRCTPNGQLQITPYLHANNQIVIPEAMWLSPEMTGTDSAVTRGPLTVEPGHIYWMFLAVSQKAVTCIARDTTTSRLWICQIRGIPLDGFNGWGYYLYPYFGGTLAAPHTIHIWMRFMNIDEWTRFNDGMER